MKRKHYSGYQSFQYLEPGVDYKPFKLARQLGRVASTPYPVTGEPDARVRRLFEEHPVISLHGDHVGLHHVFASQLSISSAHGTRDFEAVEYVDGLENPAECFWNITRWLAKHGYSDADIAKVVGGNVLRVLEQVWV
jgi:Membrane dipeptidase (Peptidase family M19)